MDADTVWEYLARPEVLSGIAAGNEPGADTPFRREVAEQVALRQRAAAKLPWIAGRPFLLTSRALEQCSGDAAAAYKAAVLAGTSVCDLTGGLGMDALAFHRAGMRVTYCERNRNLARMFELNCGLNGIADITVHTADGIQVLGTVDDGAFDGIYCDPDRRSKGKRHVALHTCEPDIITHMPLMLSKAVRVCVKVSPALEISEAVRLLPNLAAVHVVSVDGSCKEILLVCDRNGANGNPAVKTVLLAADGAVAGMWEARFSASGPGGTPVECRDCVFVPDAALVKSRCGDAYAAEHGLAPLQAGQNLYTGAVVPDGFPGKAYRVTAHWPWHRKTVGSALKKRGVDACTLHVYWHKTDQAAARRLLKIDRAVNDVHLFLCYGPGGKKMAILCEKFA